jgi:cytochrome c oxidase subunit 1
MPRRYYLYQPEFQIYHHISTGGSYIMALGFVITGIYLLHSLFWGKKAPANPWGGKSLEWQCSSPPPHDNFATTPTVGDPYDFSDLKWDPATGGYATAPAVGAKTSRGGH